MAKTRMVYSYYVTDELTELHKFHLKLLNLYSPIFNVIDFILCVNDINNNDLINKTKNEIYNYIDYNDNINFIVYQNNSYLREGLIYKEMFINNLNNYADDELVFFAHTKGVSNKLNLENLENTKIWIALMYWGNLSNFYDVCNEIYTKDNVCYGIIYNYDSSNSTKYHWQYSGSFQWVNPKRLYKILQDNKFNYEMLNGNEKRMIAEMLLGNNVKPELVAFLNHEKYNKYYSPLLYESCDYCYYDIEYPAYMTMSPYNVNLFRDFYKNIYYN